MFLKGTRISEKVFFMQERVVGKYLHLFEKVINCKDNGRYKSIIESLIVYKNAVSI